MNKTIIIGDVHLGKGLSIGKPASDGGINSRILDQSKLLNWILSKGIEHQIDRFILTGDIFEETYPSFNVVMIFIGWLKECTNHNIDVHIIFGNHDIKRIGRRYESILDILQQFDLPHVYFYNDIYTLHTPGVSFTLLPFRDKRALGKNTLAEAITEITNKFPYELSSIPTGNDKVLIGHVSLENSFYDDEIDDTSNELMFPVDSFMDYDYTINGHIHKPQIMNKVPHICHIGSMDLSNFGETKHKKIIVLYDPEADEKYTEIQLPTRPLVRIRLEIPKEEDPTDYLILAIEKENNLKDSIIKLEIKIEDPNAPEIDRSRIQNILDKNNVFHIAGFSETRNTSIIPDDRRDLGDVATEPKEAVKYIADLYFDNEDEEDKALFIQEANLCIELLKEKEKEKS